MSCFLISSKTEDIYPPSIKKITYENDCLLNRKNLIKMEQIILKFVEFDIIFPTAFDFAQILLNEF